MCRKPFYLPLFILLSLLTRPLFSVSLSGPLPLGPKHKPLREIGHSYEGDNREPRWDALSASVFEHSPQSKEITATSNSGSTVHQTNRRRHPLWTGARFTDIDRSRAVCRGVEFVYRTTRNRVNFASYGDDYVWWFYSIATRARDKRLRRMAWRIGLDLARKWRQEHRALPRDADAATVYDFVDGDALADEFALHDYTLKKQIRCAASRFSARDYLSFDPTTEAPPADVPEDCEYCGTQNRRGSKSCSRCNKPLLIRTRYDVWYSALITTYTGDRAGVLLGANYDDVLRWLPSLQPYCGRENGTNPEFDDTVYSVTHVVYTLGDYWKYKLSRDLLPREYAFLKENLFEAITLEDTDMLGEIIDSLKSFGVTSEDSGIRKGIELLLSRQNSDGSWGDIDEEDIYNRYHPTETAVNALIDYDFRCEGLSFPKLRSLLEQWSNKQ